VNTALLIVNLLSVFALVALASTRDINARRALADAYRDQELLREQLYLMRVAGDETLGAGSSVATRRSLLRDGD
jgi:hypothetical protein